MEINTYVPYYAKTCSILIPNMSRKKFSFKIVSRKMSYLLLHDMKDYPYKG